MDVFQKTMFFDITVRIPAVPRHRENGYARIRVFERLSVSVIAAFVSSLIT